MVNLIRVPRESSGRPEALTRGAIIVAASKWRSIADDLRKKIESGEIARGAQLPTEQELQEEYDASRNTIRDSIRWLIQRRLVETYPGRGTFVSAKITPFAVALSPRM